MTRPDRKDERGFTLIELMVVITLLGVVATAITGVVINTLRVEQDQQRMQDVIDDGRLSMQRIRHELRQVRRVHESSGPDRLHVWIDSNQNSIAEEAEQVCYVVEQVEGGREDQYQISRWDHADEVGTAANDYTDSDCVPGRELPAGQTRRVVASTLLDPNPFVDYTPVPAGPLEPQTREVTMRLDLEVPGGADIGSVTVHSSIRLRNVP